jgi:hypothetical protein
VRGAGAELAAEATKNLAEFPRVSVVNADFEKWVERSQPESFGLIYAATAWH